MDAWMKDRVMRLVKFLISLMVAIGITLLIKEPDFNDSQVYVLFLLFFSIGLWLTEAIPAFAVSLFIIAFLVFALGNKYFNSQPEDIAIYVNTFSSSVIWLMMGGFLLASAMIHCSPCWTNAAISCLPAKSSVPLASVSSSLRASSLRPALINARA